MTRNVDKFVTCTSTGVLLSIINVLIGAVDYSVIMLLICMVTDFATGVLSGCKNGNLSSKRCFNGLCKKLMILVYVILAHHFDVLLGLDNIVRMGVCYMYIVNETISITENGVKLGVEAPHAIKKALEILQDGGKNNEGK